MDAADRARGKRPWTLPQGSAPTFLVLLVVVGILAALLATLVPLPECPDCLGGRIQDHLHESLPIPSSSAPSSLPWASAAHQPVCLRCRDATRVTVVNRLFRQGWEGYPMSAMVSRGFVRTDTSRMITLSGLHFGEPLTRDRVDSARSQLLSTGEFRSVVIDVQKDALKPGRAKVLLVVSEK